MKKELTVKAIVNGNGSVNGWWYVAKEIKPTCLHPGKWSNFVLVKNHIDRSKRSVVNIDNFVIVAPGEPIDGKPLKEFIAYLL